MSIVVILAVVLILGALVVFALALGGYWETPEQLLGQIRAFARSKSEPPAAFRAWIDNDLKENPALRDWLLSLPNEGFAMLTDRVVKFCADLNIRLSWLVQGEIAVAPPLRQAVKTIVVDYLEVCWEALRHQADIGIFDKYHALISHPADARYRDARRALFTRLIAEGLAEPLPTYELIMASELQRQSMAARAIREAAAKDWVRFGQIFAEVLAERAGHHAAESPAVRNPA
jgi:hypothetical protein